MIHRFSTPVQSKSNRIHRKSSHSPPKTHRKSMLLPKNPRLDPWKISIKTCLFLRNFCRKKTGFSWMTQRLIKIFRIVRWLNLPIGVSFVDWTRKYFNCVWVELELFLSGFSDVTVSMVFSYRVVSETGFLFRENSLQNLSSNFEQLIFNDEWTSFLCHVKFILLHSKFFPPNLSKKFTLQKSEFTLQRSFCHDGSILGHLKLLLIMLILIIYLNTNANFYMKFQSPVFLLLQINLWLKLKIVPDF